MKKISDVITEELFVNAYKICKKYSEKEFITDINLMLLKNAFQSITENNVRAYYQKYFMLFHIFFLQIQFPFLKMLMD